jgi:hypothetical protein
MKLNKEFDASQPANENVMPNPPTKSILEQKVPKQPAVGFLGTDMTQPKKIENPGLMKDHEAPPQDRYGNQA